jgi:hypothetical protein
MTKKTSQFGDPVLRHRIGELSVTVMAGQPEFMFLQYGRARAFGIKLPIGWFGIGGVYFPKIESAGGNCYIMRTSVKGQYWQIFDRKFAERFNGNFSAMPNTERESVNIVEAETEIKINLLDNGVDLEIKVSDTHPILTQIVCMFDTGGEISGDIEKINEYIIKLTKGAAVYEYDDCLIKVTGESTGHNMKVIRGDTLNEKARNLILNAVSPNGWKVGFRCFRKNCGNS